MFTVKELTKYGDCYGKVYFSLRMLLQDERASYYKLGILDST